MQKDTTNRKSFNVSLQKNRNRKVFQPLLDECDAKGDTISDRVVEYVEQAMAYENSIALQKVLSAYELVNKTLSAQLTDDELTAAVEQSMQKIIEVNAFALGQFLINPTEFATSKEPVQHMHIEQMVAATTTSQVSSTTHTTHDNQNIVEDKKEGFNNSPETKPKVSHQEETDSTVDKVVKEETSLTKKGSSDNNEDFSNDTDDNYNEEEENLIVNPSVLYNE